MRRKPLPEPEANRHHANELDRLRRQMRMKDLSDMVHRLEQLKGHAKTPQDIINTLEDVKENLEYLEADVNENSSFITLFHSFIRNFV